MNTVTNLEYAAFVGIEWADRRHDVCLQSSGRSKREFSVLAHRPESLKRWSGSAATAHARVACARFPKPLRFSRWTRMPARPSFGGWRRGR